MNNVNQPVEKLVVEIKESLAHQVGYQMDDAEVDELRLTGRFSINAPKFLPYLPAMIVYLRNNDVTWTLTLNTISQDFEITLKDFQIVI